jgi:Ca2+-binding EF-hand superfamily protein
LKDLIKESYGVDKRYQVSEDYLLKTFHKLDTDNSGTISRQEMKPFVIGFLQQQAQKNAQ